MARPVSEYERLRMDNIARNEQFMRSLGLDDLGSASRLQKRKPPPGTSAAKKKNKSATSVNNQLPAAETVQRRSLRIADIPIQNYDLDAAGILDDDADDDDDDADSSGKGPKKSSKPRPPPAPPSADSSRALNAEVDRFLGPEIGSLMSDVSTGKAAIMSIANGGRPPRFSKYSGVVEWKNCVFLWVNIGGNGGYKNCFSEKGPSLFMSWFGGSKMTAETPSTKRLLRAGKGGENVLLFVRLPDEPYCCLGQLATRQSKLGKHPIELEFELLDSERLRKSKHFGRVLSETM